MQDKKVHSYLLTIILFGICVLFLTVAYEPNTKFYHISFMEHKEPVHPVFEKMLDYLHRQGSDVNILRCNDSVSEVDRFYDFIHQPGLDQNDIVLGTSAENSVLVKSHKDIRKKFKLQKTPILFSGSISKHFSNMKIKQFDNFPNLESSLFIGRVWAFRLCFSGYLKNKDMEPNIFWSKELSKHPNLIRVDNHAELFLYAEGIDKKDIQFDRFKADIHYVQTNTHPYVLCAEDPEYLYTVVNRWKEQ